MMCNVPRLRARCVAHSTIYNTDAPPPPPTQRDNTTCVSTTRLRCNQPSTTVTPPAMAVTTSWSVVAPGQSIYPQGDTEVVCFRSLLHVLILLLDDSKWVVTVGH